MVMANVGVVRALIPLISPLGGTPGHAVVFSMGDCRDLGPVPVVCPYWLRVSRVASEVSVHSGAGSAFLGTSGNTELPLRVVQVCLMRKWNATR
jgi:hypothetical protein